MLPSFIAFVDVDGFVGSIVVLDGTCCGSEDDQGYRK